MPSPASDSAWRTRRPRYPEPAGPQTPSGSKSAWISRQVQAMASAWSRGERVSAEQLLASHPELGDEAAIRLIYEEVCLRRESGQDIATTEVVNRFPRWKDELEVLLGCDRMLRPFSRVAHVSRRRRRPRPVSAAGGARPRGFRQDLPGGRARAREPAGRLEGDHRRSGRAPLAGQAAAHAYHPAVLGAELARAGAAGALHALPRRGEPGPDSRGGRPHSARGASRPPSPRCPRPRAESRCRSVDGRRSLPPLPRAGVVRPGGLLDRRLPGRRACKVHMLTA